MDVENETEEGIEDNKTVRKEIKINEEKKNSDCQQGGQREEKEKRTRGEEVKAVEKNG